MALTTEHAEELERWLATIGGTLQSSEFQTWNRAFLADNCTSFEDVDENKLEHTELHAEYQRQVEARIEAAIAGTDVDMAALLARLPAYIGRANAPPARDERRAVLEAIETLSSLADFNAFKAAMLVARKDGAAEARGAAGQGARSAAEYGDAAAAGAAAALDNVEGCVEFAAAMDAATDGWVLLARKDWMVIEKRPMPGAKSAKEIVMRYAFDVDLPCEHLVPLFADYSERRGAWDDAFRSSEQLGAFEPRGGAGSSDVAIGVRYKLPWLLKLMGVPELIDMRVVVVADHPSPGASTFAAVPWDRARAQLDRHNAHFQVALGIARPHPDDPALRARYTGFEVTQMGAAPDWLLGWLAGTFSPRYVLGMASRYRRNVLDASSKLRHQ